LAHIGHDVIEARDGQEGLRLFPDSNAELVITDLVMPEKEGLEVLMELRGSHPDLKIIAMSGGGRQNPADNLRIAKYLGASLVLYKPIMLQDLKAALEKVLA